MAFICDRQDGVGRYRQHRVVEQENPNLTFALGRNAPNPLVEQTEIIFSIMQAQSVQLSVFDLQGRGLMVPGKGRLNA